MRGRAHDLPLLALRSLRQRDPCKKQAAPNVRSGLCRTLGKCLELLGPDADLVVCATRIQSVAAHQEVADAEDMRLHLAGQFALAVPELELAVLAAGDQQAVV